MAGEDFTSRARARARAAAAELGAARRQAAALFPNASAHVERLGESLQGLLAQEIAPGRLMPWLPIGFGTGIILYFTADHEPAGWAAAGAAAFAVALAVIARRRFISLAVALAVASIACGFAVATFKTSSIAHPVLRFPITAEVKGFVEVREEREKSDRIVVGVTHLDAKRLDRAPERVRVAVRKGTAPAVGDFVVFRARLLPPLGPLRPSGYDFARDMFFQNIGASGYVFGRIKVEHPPDDPGFGLRYRALIDGVREEIDDRIKASLSGDRGSIASALITGKRDAISTPVNDAMYVSSLAHVLSISGYHMAVVAGVVFFVLRATLALFPGLATRQPIKKWSAIAALLAATFYLLLSGAEVATQRSYIMIAIVLVGVMLDRPALTFRTLAVAAFVVLLLAPQAVVHPSFQMSFAATLALVAGYQYTLPWRPTADTSLQARAALWGAREIVGLVLASLVAGFATTPYAAFHFHRLAPYGVLANLLAMPVVSGWVMPMGILGVIALPFGFDAPFWRLMGEGIDWMTAVAQWVAHLPGAIGRIAAFGSGPLLVASAGLVVVCLLRTRLRWTGAAMIALAAGWASLSPQPDVYIAGDGQTAAVRAADGHLRVLHHGRDTFAIKEWLAADADPRTTNDKTLTSDVQCDDIGCIAHLSDGRAVAMPLTVEALLEDCERAAVVVSSRAAPSDKCTAALFDRDILRQYGSISLRMRGPHAEISAARPPGYRRPWAESPQRKAARQQPDATPPLNRLDPSDY
jgi:competence protein ComEC